MTTPPQNNKIEIFKLIFQSNFLKNPNHNIVIPIYFPYKVFFFFWHSFGKAASTSFATTRGKKKNPFQSLYPATKYTLSFLTGLITAVWMNGTIWFRHMFQQKKKTTSLPLDLVILILIYSYMHSQVATIVHKQSNLFSRAELSL